jgi:PhnB protein
LASEFEVAAIQAHLCVASGTEAIAFYEKAFGAVATFRQMADDGVRILHANLSLFGGQIMLHDEFPEFGGDVVSPASAGGASVAISINLPNASAVDAAVSRAIEAGAIATMPVEDAFWGARYGRVRDPFGHVWAFNAPLGV